VSLSTAEICAQAEYNSAVDSHTQLSTG